MTATDEPLHPAYVADVLSRPPLVQISGVSNGMRTEAQRHPISRTKMKALGITIMFDLRSDPEMQKYSTPISTIEGVQMLRASVFANEDYSPESMANRRIFLFMSLTTELLQAFMKLYSQILDHGGRASARKDRTGIIAAILFKLAGVDDHLICQDYSLTIIDCEKILRRLLKEPLFAADTELALRMLTSRFRYETIHATFSLCREEHGGVQVYVKNFSGLTDDDVSTIRANLVVTAEVHTDVMAMTLSRYKNPRHLTRWLDGELNLGEGHD
ncbi:protein-tyrosine phosphatase-like protein [Melanogaster broomeanus]|nr:protein-tyrosine phosphatase-like protein [Melanogaster broomeanus]